MLFDATPRPALRWLVPSATLGMFVIALAGACSSDPAAAGASEADAQAPNDAGAPDADAGAEAAAPIRVPTAGDIGFKARAPLGAGELLVFNDWSASPNTLSTMKPDGSGQAVVFDANRVWSFGVSHDRKKIAFACADPFAEQNHGITIGDAIQHTWVHDVTAGTATLLSSGNVNDECHGFGPGDKELWVCRRYDFTPEGRFKGWRLGKTDLATGVFSFESPEETATIYRLDPTVTPDGLALFDTRLEIKGSTQSYSIERRPLPSGATSVAVTDAGRMRISPDGTKMVFANYADGRKLYVRAVDGAAAPIKILDAEATDPAFSPDGQRVAYLMNDKAANCQHVEIVKTDGSDAASPTRVHDCAAAKDFITALAWIAP